MTFKKKTVNYIINSEVWAYVTLSLRLASIKLSEQQ